MPAPESRPRRRERGTGVISMRFGCVFYEYSILMYSDVSCENTVFSCILMYSEMYSCILWFAIGIHCALCILVYSVCILYVS